MSSARAWRCSSIFFVYRAVFNNGFDLVRPYSLTILPSDIVVNPNYIAIIDNLGIFTSTYFDFQHTIINFLLYAKIQRYMNITYNDLREIKHKLPTGSISKIANELNMDEQTVRNYFGAQKYKEGEVVSLHREPGPAGGVIHLEDDRIINIAMKILGQEN